MSGMIETNASVNVCRIVTDAVTGKLLQREEQHNLVTLAGRNLIRDSLYWNSPLDDPRRSGLNAMALGTGTTAVAAGDAALETEVFRDVFTARIKSEGQTVYWFHLSSLCANNHALTEAGLFADSDTLYARVIFPPLVKTDAIAITYSWTLTWEAR